MTVAEVMNSVRITPTSRPHHHHPRHVHSHTDHSLLQPEFAESVQVRIKHISHVEATGVSFVPILQLPVVGVVI